MRHVVDMPEAWQSLDLRADVIGRRTLKSGRQSVLSNEPLFFLARSIIGQVTSQSIMYARREVDRNNRHRDSLTPLS